MTALADDPWIQRLEKLLGDPDGPDNPLGFAAVLAADERGELLADGEAALAAHGLNAEFVPVAHGGRLDAADRLAHRLRGLFRRDCSLAIGYGVTSLIGGVPIWVCGDKRQREWAARLLLSGGRVAAAYTELPHGADFTRVELTARRAGDRLVLRGRKDLVNNVARAEAVSVFARTDDRPGSRGQSHLLVEPAALPPDRYERHVARYETSGVRGCRLGGISFDDCPVPADALVGPAGSGLETVLRGFQLTRAVLPGMVLGGLDTLLRVAMRWAGERRLYGQRLDALPQTREVLTGAYTDLLIGDCLATTAARALHLLPGQASMLSAAVKVVVPALIQDAAAELSVLLGARGYLREGPHGIFQKMARDLPVVSLAHASTAVCLASILTQLPRWARKARDEAAPPALFRPGDRVPELSFAALRVDNRGEDAVTATLPLAADAFAGHPELGPLTRSLVAELERVAADALALPARDTTVVAGPAGFAVAERYALLVAASACAGVRLHGEAGLSDEWLAIALCRLLDRLHLPAPPSPQGLWAELRTRHESGHTFDLARHHLRL